MLRVLGSRMYPIFNTHGFGLAAGGVTDHCAERREARAARGRRGIVPFGGRPRADRAESRNALRRVYCG